jgi:hypothetical protein
VQNLWTTANSALSNGNAAVVDSGGASGSHTSGK